jgi:2-dehydro-3-deoxy-L-rhamnonate dehydrogenase (NAD+)
MEGSNGSMALDGRLAIVTGGARGIGMAVCQRLLDAGASVAIWDVDGEAAGAAAEDLGAHNGRVRFAQVDVREPASIETGMESALDGAEEVDVLVNNAGIVGTSGPITELSDEHWRETIDSDLTSVFNCCRAVLPRMRRDGRASIVNIASVTGKEGNPNQIPYSVAKAGVIALTKALARETAPQIRVNCVAPALTRTRILDDLPDEVIEYALERIPLGRLGEPGEVAAVVHFLASDDAAFVTGQCYDVSGGRSSY